MGYDFDLSEPISDAEINALVLECAHHNQIVTDAEHARQFTSKAIRRGVAAEVVHALRNATGNLNRRSLKGLRTLKGLIRALKGPYKAL